LLASCFDNENREIISIKVADRTGILGEWDEAFGVAADAAFA